jgi:hypothetical protein
VVSLAVRRQTAKATVQPESAELVAELDDLVVEATTALDELRHIARGITWTQLRPASEGDQAVSVPARRARSARTRPLLAHAGDGHHRRRPGGSMKTPRQSSSGHTFSASRSAVVSVGQAG